MSRLIAGQSKKAMIKRNDQFWILGSDQMKNVYVAVLLSALGLVVVGAYVQFTLEDSSQHSGLYHFANALRYVGVICIFVFAIRSLGDRKKK